MSLFIASLNSGSNGNCYYIGNDTEAILVDAGISCRETELRMARLGLSMQQVKAVFISHEHWDHIRGLPVLAKKYHLPVYITPQTMQQAGLYGKRLTTLPFQAHQPIQIGGLQITAFPKLHDAADPHSFIVSYNDVTVGILTDIGTCCDNVVEYFKKCQAVFLESNFDEVMLDKGGYPAYLKKRIRSMYGHLSNDQALELFRTCKSSDLTHVLLSHLSKNNNNPLLAKALFEAHAGDTEVIIASRDEATAVFKISGSSVLI
ncbi:MBL fold metallo-hydrolase [Cytophagaceae bacterium DM2B3-1]|uniref:MBL fold metallo-hydrolase n=2 Tax=Xanthocytophaga TaxID=3078918 RepID=A0ABT7CMI6_9BACT|nr:MULTISPECIES: MBL fold metallo-hydrolase [Xanthocytophaga]MDJ1469343.1 MBL fold metallo-hydrolase [Xanthocytophaga flavus]MDJ1494197.1 MBL fold metallo-hydrolase [Xanthocytophaga flavus]MDJ1499293.1 MBL fold metallo-hydrolase [Xanthocytophaga agilis]